MGLLFYEVCKVIANQGLKNDFSVGRLVLYLAKVGLLSIP
jgi:hypothetical protein